MAVLLLFGAESRYRGEAVGYSRLALLATWWLELLVGKSGVVLPMLFVWIYAS